MSSWSVLFIVCYKNRPCFSTIHGSRAIQRENRVAGTCHPAALSPAGYVFATVNTEWMLSRGTVWLYLSSFHFPGNQFDLPFWILKYETINSSCLVLNSARSKQLVHAAVREAVDRGVTSARQSGGSAINLFSSLIHQPSWSLEHWDLQLYGVLDWPSHTSRDCLTPGLHSSLSPSACGPVPGLSPESALLRLQEVMTADLGTP